MRYLDREELGLLARRLREEAGLSQTEVAKRIRSTQSNVSAAETGKSSRYIGVALSIIKVVGDKSIEGPFYKVTENHIEKYEQQP